MLSSRGTYTSDHLLQAIAHTHTTTAAHIIYHPGELRAVWAALGACVRRALTLGGPALAAPSSVGGTVVTAPRPAVRPASSSVALSRPASAGPIRGRPGSAVSSSFTAGGVSGGSRRPSSVGGRQSAASQHQPPVVGRGGVEEVRTAVSLFRRSIFFWTSPTVVATEAGGFHRSETRYCVRTPHLGFGTAFATTYGLTTTTAQGRQSLLAPAALLALPVAAIGGPAPASRLSTPASSLLIDDVALSTAALAAEAGVPTSVAAACLGDIVRSIGEMLHAGRVLQLQLPTVGTILLKADRVQAQWDESFIAALLEADTRRWPTEVAAMAAARFLPRPQSAAHPTGGGQQQHRALPPHSDRAMNVQTGEEFSGHTSEEEEEEFDNGAVPLPHSQQQQPPRRPPSTVSTTTHTISAGAAAPFRPASGGPCTIEELERRAANARRAQIVHAAAKFSRIGNTNPSDPALAPAVFGAAGATQQGIHGRPPLAVPPARHAGSGSAMAECHVDPLACVTPPMAVCCDEVVPSSLLPRAVAGRLADGTPVRMGRQESVYDMVLPAPRAAAEVVGEGRLSGVTRRGGKAAGFTSLSAEAEEAAAAAPAPASAAHHHQSQPQQQPQQQPPQQQQHNSEGQQGVGRQPPHHHHTHTDIFGFRPQSAEELRAAAEAEWGPARGRKRFGIISGGGGAV